VAEKNELNLGRNKDRKDLRDLIKILPLHLLRGY